MRIIVPLLAAAVGVWGGYSLMHAVAPTSDKAQAGSNGSGGTSSGGGPPPELKGGETESMLRPAPFAKALAVLRDEGGGGPGARIYNVRLDPSKLLAQVDADNKQVSLYVTPDAKVFSRSVEDRSNSFPEEELAVGKVRAGAPWKIVRALGEKAGIKPNDVDYMVLEVDPISHKAEWLTYLKGVTRSYYRAALNGSHPTRCC